MLSSWMKNVNEIIPVRWWSTKSGIPVSYLNELKRGSKDNPSLSHLRTIAQAVGHDVYILPKHDYDQHYHLYPYLLHLMDAWVQVNYARQIWIDDVAEEDANSLLSAGGERAEILQHCEKALDLLIFFCNEFDCSAMEFILKADKDLQNFDPTESGMPMEEWPFAWELFSIGLLSHAVTPRTLESELENSIRKVLSVLRYMEINTKDVLNGTDNPLLITEYEKAIQRCENADEVPYTNAGSQSTSISG